MRFLRTNTAVIITVGPFYDKTDGVTIETALTITNERITLTADTDAGSAPTNILDNIAGATAATANDLNYITGNDAGMMQLELAAADVNRLGRMYLSITDAANHVPVFHEFMVLPQAIYDWLILGTIVPLPVNVTTWRGTAAPAEDTAGYPKVTVKDGAGVGEINTNAGKVVGVELVDVLTTYTGNTPQTGDSFARLGAPAGASIAADLVVIDNFVDGLEATIGAAGAGLTAIADQVWDEDATGHQTQGTFGQAIGDPVADANTLFKAVVTDAAGATVGVDVVAVKAETAAIEAQTDDIGVAGAGLTALGDTRLANLDATVSSRLSTAGYTAPPTAAVIADAVLDEDMTAHQTQGSLGQAIGDPVADTNTLFKAVVTDAAGATVGVDIVAVKAETATIAAQTDDIGVAGAGLTALGDARLANLDATVSSRLATAGYTAPPTAAVIADAVLDEDMTAHQTQGSLGQAIGDPVTDANTIYKAVVTDATGATIGVDVVALDARTPEALIGGKMDSITSVMDGAVIVEIGDELENRAPLFSPGIADEVWNRDATSNQFAGTFGKALGDPAAGLSLLQRVDAVPAATKDEVFARVFSAAYDSLTFDEMVKLIAAVLHGKASGMAGTTGTFRNLADTGDVVVATVDADGNRTAVTRTP